MVEMIEAPVSVDAALRRSRLRPKEDARRPRRRG
jgi:hypothetical protein